jgi:hypothetical protein
MAGRPPGRPRKFDEEAQVFTLRLPVSLRAAIRAYADDGGLSINNLLLRTTQAWWGTVLEHEKYDRAAKRSTSSVGAGPKRSKP